ncbi:MAG TPA: peptidyl-prolyl cis-trans isomerase [Candidatus Methylacidiphilales bacterium]|nr:peptidyl-prolyl cis-trans isomerase [Candidatus Methylacidiphilales bacterium]
MARLPAQRTLMRTAPHRRSRFAVHLFLWSTVFLCLAPVARAQYLADGIAAVVNDKIITYVQINQQVADTVNLLRQNYQGQELFQRVQEQKLNVLKALIDRELIIQDFKTAGGFIPDTFTAERINDIIRDQYGGDRVAFIKTLYERGITMQKYKDEIQDNAIVGYMRNRNVVQTVLVSPYQIEQYYQQNLRLFQQDEQIKVATIVLHKSLFPSTRTGPDGKPQTYDPQQEITNEILYKIDTGSDFSDLAKSYSEAGNKDQGGELGWVTQNGKTAIRADLWPAISKLQPGQHTDVIATDDGYYYIVLVEDRKKAAMTPLEDVRAEIEKKIIDDQLQIRQQQWLDSLRAKAFIKMFP